RRHQQASVRRGPCPGLQASGASDAVPRLSLRRQAPLPSLRRHGDVHPAGKGHNRYRHMTIVKEKTLDIAVNYLSEDPHPTALAHKDLLDAETETAKVEGELFLKTEGTV